MNLYCNDPGQAAKFDNSDAYREFILENCSRFVYRSVALNSDVAEYFLRFAEMARCCS